MTGVAIALAALFSLLSFQHGYRAGLQHELDKLGAHILVVPKGCPYDAASIALHGANWPCYLKSQYLEEVRATPGVSAAAPVLMAAFYNEPGRQTVYAGIDTNILSLKRAWRIHGKFPQATNDVLVGADVARQFKLRVGGQFSLPGLEKQNGFVAGIIDPTSGPDDGFVFLTLSSAQALLGHSNELTHILVRLKDPNQLEQVVGQLRGCDAGLYMNIVPLAHLFETIRSVVNSARVLMGCIAFVALFAAMSGLANSILMSLNERTGEIGVMRALGASRLQVGRLIWSEAMGLCGAGALLGCLAAFGAARFIESWLRSRLPFAPSEPLIEWQFWIVAVCLAISLVAGTLACLAPVIRVTLLHPMEAIRQRNT